jgi:hypothetical protein
MPDLEVSDDFPDSAITRIRSAADQPVFTAPSQRFSPDQTGSTSVGSVIGDSQALRSRLHEVVRDNILELNAKVSSYGYVRPAAPDRLVDDHGTSIEYQPYGGAPGSTYGRKSDL